MDRSETIVWEYLSHRGFRDVVFEPDGNVTSFSTTASQSR
jgi:hypothetical protein